MDRTNVPRQLLRVVGRLAACAASISLLCTAPAFADQLEQHNELVNKFVNDMHADPLVADCAAHGNFVASTSSAFDHVEFPPSSFDEGKQRVKVDNIVTVEGLGIRQNGDSDPADLKFRCGYVGSQMLAFSWNDPVPPARPSVTKPSGKHKGGKGKHSTGNKSSAKKSSGKNSKKTPSSKSSGKTSSKKSTKKTQ